MSPVHVLDISRASRRHRSKAVACEHCGEHLALLPTPKRQLAWSEITTVRSRRSVTLYFCRHCTERLVAA